MTKKKSEVEEKIRVKDAISFCEVCGKLLSIYNRKTNRCFFHQDREHYRNALRSKEDLMTS